ncbi:hypothetical protein MHYP_G00347180 [Metynnis hypsauchen]
MFYMIHIAETISEQKHIKPHDFIHTDSARPATASRLQSSSSRSEEQKNLLQRKHCSCSQDLQRTSASRSQGSEKPLQQREKADFDPCPALGALRELEDLLAPDHGAAVLESTFALIAPLCSACWSAVRLFLSLHIFVVMKD